MTPAEVPTQLRDLLDQAAGKTHGDDGPVMVREGLANDDYPRLDQPHDVFLTAAQHALPIITAFIGAEVRAKIADEIETYIETFVDDEHTRAIANILQLAAEIVRGPA